MEQPKPGRTRRLIEEWLPIAALGEESARERRSMTALPPTYYLHVWWARRPLVASRAAILASLLPADADRAKFLHMLGIHGDPVAAKARMAEAGKNIDSITGKRENLGPNPYGYSRAFKYTADEDELRWLRDQALTVGYVDPSVLDPTAGGGSVPFEGRRLGVRVIANELNPVAWLILKCTIEFPFKYGDELPARVAELGRQLALKTGPRLVGIFADEAEGTTVDGYLWARTVKCPYCSGIVPLSPSWRLDANGTGVRIVAHTEDPDKRYCSFEIVEKATEQSLGTIKGGDGLCPFPDCGRVIDGDEIKSQAQAGHMGQQLYAVATKQVVSSGKSNASGMKGSTIRRFRAVEHSDDREEVVLGLLKDKIDLWNAAGILPTEEIDALSNYDRGHRMYGMERWTDMFTHRQLYCFGVVVESWCELFHELREERDWPAQGLRCGCTYLLDIESRQIGKL